MKYSDNFNYREAKMKKPIFLPLAKDGNYVCPVCGDGSGLHGTGMKYYEDTHSYFCFKCWKLRDTLDLFGEYFGISDMREKKRRFQEYYEAEDINIDTATPSTADSTEKKENQRTIDYTDYFKMCFENSDGKYLSNRGISKNVQDEFYIGFDPAWTNPAVKHSRRIPSPRIIIPMTTASYFSRDIRMNLTGDEKKYEKIDVGPKGLYGIKSVDREKPVVVVEGQIDALSVYEAGGQAVALCGAGSYKKVLDIATEFPRLILMLDMDNVGRKMQANLYRDLDEKDINCECTSYCHHDPNEYLQADSNGFCSFINNLMMK